MTDRAPDRARDLAREHFEIGPDGLRVGGCSVAELAEEFGTPLFIYDAAGLRRQLSRLRRALPECIDVYYSVKANPNPAVIRCLLEEGTGLEVASGSEYLRARSAGGNPSRIVFAGPGKGLDELELVTREGIEEIHVESDEEIDCLQSLDRAIGVSVRFNPSAAASGGAMRMGGQPTQFGFDEEEVEEVIRRVRRAPGLDFRGVHMFAGTQILEAETLVGQWAHALSVARRAGEFAGRPVHTVDLGGGLGIPYFANEKPLDLDRVKELAEELFGDRHGLEGARFILEPGRFLTGPAGLYVGRIRAVKHSRGKRFLVLDGGMNHHLAASGNLGQVIKRDYPVLNVRNPDADRCEPATVVGPLCTPLDTICRAAALPQSVRGDLIAVLQSGAYGLSASPVGFLSHPMPAEVLVDAGVARLIRPRGTLEQPITPLP